MRVLGITNGVVAGIALGAIFFKLLGYFWLYTCFAILLVVPLILLRLFPERKEVEASRRGEGVGWWDVLSTRRVWVAQLTVLVCADGILFSLEATLALKLHQAFGFS